MPKDDEGNLSEEGRKLRQAIGLFMLLLFLFMYLTNPGTPKLISALLVFAGSFFLLESLYGVCLWHVMRGTREGRKWKSEKVPSIYNSKLMRCTAVELIFSAMVALIIYLFI